MEAETQPKPIISPKEWRLIYLLFAIQFTHILDFVIMMPLGPQFIHDLQIGPNRFGTLVSVYGFAAALGSLLAATMLDQFDRKKSLLFLYGGFTISTLFCGLAPTYELLLVARSAAGAFGGVVGVAIMAIIGDVFADYRRGTATGAVMSAFAVSSVAGVPLGLLLAETFGLWAPFVFLAGLSAIIFVFGLKLLPTFRGHILDGPRQLHHSFWAIVKHPNHRRAYLFSLVLVLGSFTVIPYIATYMVQNTGRSKEDVKWVYLVGGLCTLVSMNLIGRMSDRYGKLIIFRVTAFLSLLMCLWITNLPTSSLFVSILVGSLFMVTTSGRIVPAQAMMIGSASPQIRGAFLGINTALQHFAMGAASLIGGLLLSESDGKLEGYPLVGAIAAGCALIALWVAGRLRPTPEGIRRKG